MMKTGKGLIILHFREISKYPPIINLIKYLDSKKELYEVATVPKLIKDSSSMSVFINYCIYSIKGFLKILSSNKQSVFYYESLSALPAFFYFALFPFSKKRLFIHYHEYFSGEDYEKQSFYERLGRKLEINLFKRASWISHTNEHRLTLFKKEYPYLSDTILNVMPNYPPTSWIKSVVEIGENQSNKIRLLHIGSLSKRGMYLENLLNCFGNNPGFRIDFYSHKFTDDVKDLISNYGNCRICGSIAYNDIPSLRGMYDIGLVLYDGSSVNFTYNAPNKIFEYLALDLDVWCSDKLITARDYERLDCHPKMIMVDYENLVRFDVEKAMDKTGLPYILSPYVCEPVYERIVCKIMKS